MPFFQKAKLRVNEELQIIMPNATTMITISNLQLTLGDYGYWVKAHTAPLPPPIPPTVREGSTT